MSADLPPTITDAIFSLCPSAAFTIEANNLSTLEWLIPLKDRPEETGTPFIGVVNQEAEKWWDKIPSKDEILKEFERLNAEFEKTQYARNRKYSYPSIGDQLDALFHAGVFPEEMAAKIQEVKDRYPKP